MSLLLLLPSLVFSTERITFKTRDGVVLHGVYQAPRGDNPVLVMLHGLGSYKEEWRPLEMTLEQSSWGYFAYDARGHGESSQSKDESGNPNGYKTLGLPGPSSLWERMIDDLGAATGFLQKEKMIDRKKIFFAGASLGANVALNFASLTRSVRPVLLLSPGQNYQEITSDAAIVNMKNVPVLLVASVTDRYAYLSCQHMKQLVPSVTLWTDVKAGHGVNMFDDKLLRRIMAWLIEHK